MDYKKLSSIFKWHKWPMPKNVKILSVYEFIAYILVLVACLTIYNMVHRVPVIKYTFHTECIHRNDEDKAKTNHTMISVRKPMSHVYDNGDPYGSVLISRILTEDSLCNVKNSQDADSLFNFYKEKIAINIDKDSIPSIFYSRVESSNSLKDISNYANKDWIINDKYTLRRTFYDDINKVIVTENYSPANMLEIKDGDLSLPFSRPTWHSLYDISQSYYEVYVEYADGETELSMNFLGVTELSKMNHEADEYTMSSFTMHTGPNYWLLNFHAFYKELESKQNSRLFIISAIFSTLIAVLVTFIVLSLYKITRNIKQESMMYYKKKEEERSKKDDESSDQTKKEQN